MLEVFADVRIDKCKQDDSGLLFDLPQGAVELRGRADESIDMGNGTEIRVLSSCGLGHSIQRFTGGVGDQVKVVESL